MEFHFYFANVPQNSNWVLISQREKIFQDVFFILKAFHFTSLKSVSISPLFIHTGPIKWLHLVDCFGWLWPWFDFKSKFHFSFLMSGIKLSCICPTQRTDRSFFSIISCSLVLKKKKLFHSENGAVYASCLKNLKTRVFHVTIIPMVNIMDN